MAQRGCLSLLFICLGAISSSYANISLLDRSGYLRLNSLSDDTSDTGGVVAVIASPGTPSILVTQDAASSDPLMFASGPPATLTCRGATLSSYGDNAWSATYTATEQQERISLATATLVAGSIVLDGITTGDIEAGLRDSRHGLTLAAIFRAKLWPTTVADEAERGGGTTDYNSPGAGGAKQTLVVPVMTKERLPISEEEKITREIGSMFSTAALEADSRRSFGELYDVKIIPYTSTEQVRVVNAPDSSTVERKANENINSA